MRNIFTVNAKQIVVSQSHPEGIVSDVSGYPVSFDSRSYKYDAETNPNGDQGIALISARANFYNGILNLENANNANRVGFCVTITRGSDGKEIDRYANGGFPDMTPQPEPEEQEQGEGE